MNLVDLSRVCVVTVTYGNRLKYLRKVVGRLLCEGVKNVVVVDNDSECDVCFDDCRVRVVHSDVNLGSGGGFRLGLKEALKTDCCYFLLLDDDNLLGRGVLRKLCDVADSGSVFFVFRHYDEKYLLKSKRELELGFLERDTLNVDSFCYFSVVKLFRMVKDFFVRRSFHDRFMVRIVANGFGRGE